MAHLSTHVLDLALGRPAANLTIDLRKAGQHLKTVTTNADGRPAEPLLHGDSIEPGEWLFDFRVGGRDIAEGTFHDGPVSRYEATYTDIVDHVRIVTTYDMWLDGIHMSTSVASLEFEPIDAGTRFTHVEHGVFFDQFWADGPNREAGTRGLLEALSTYLASRTPPTQPQP